MRKEEEKEPAKKRINNFYMSNKKYDHSIKKQMI